jgi:prolyl oligopeptidase
LYTAFDAPDGNEFTSTNEAERVQLHRLGTDQADDEVVLALPEEPEVNFWPEVTEDSRWLVIHATKGTEHETRVWVRDLDDPDGRLRALIPQADAAWSLIGSSGTSLLMLTDRDAPLGRIVALDAESGAMTELVAERSDTLEAGTVAGGRLVLAWLHDSSSRLTLHALDGTEVADVPLPGLGSVVGLEGRADESVLHVGFTSFGTPPGVLAVDAASGTASWAFRPTGLPSADVEVELVRVTSKDGTEIPVFLLHRSDVPLGGGPHPAWLYGYDFRVPMTPTFEPTRFAFAAAGGVVAVACLRGGGEYGAAWHDGGRLANKQNVFDDAIAVAEHLVGSGWTSTARLAVSGRSNGGLLAGALLTQRPDLFACVVPEVGVLDMLRFPKWTIGRAWVSDYGDPYADAEQFATLYAYSPLHQLRSGADYPPVLVLTSDHDDRVVPAHSVKFAARLQAVVDEDAVALLRVAAAGGHGHGRSQDALVAERADVLAFIAAHTGLPGAAFDERST